MTTLPEWANWLARDEHGELWAYSVKPLKVDGFWDLENSEDNCIGIEETDDTFSHIKWTDEEPTSVKALIKEFSDKAESLRELGEALTRNWEAEHGQPSIAEYNAWEITQAKAHGFDELPTTEKESNTTKTDRHEQLLKSLHATYIAKNSDYGDSFGETYRDLGIISAVTRISDKFNRMKTLAKGNEQHVDDESLTDTLLDMANYCIMTVMELEEQNAQSNVQKH